MGEKAIFRFDRGAFFSVQLNYVIENLHFMMKAYNDFHDMQCFEFDITDEDLQEIGTILNPVKNWKSKYTNPDGILDGFGWEIEYRYKGVKIKSEGYEEYPADYEEVVKELQEYIETLCKKYATDQYKEDEAEERMRL
nr:hypothetical protein [Mitsuokella multacida]